jgi:NhaA family Na+:H+ antiporter
MIITKLFNDFFESKKSGGIVLLACAIISIFMANSAIQMEYVGFWKKEVAGSPLDHWINDGLMAIFFLLIGLELERELYIGELSNLKYATLPIFAAVGGMAIPAAIHLLLNHGTATQAGAGIPMATDIAFALGILSLFGNRVPLGLKVFLTALAVIDDLGAMITIAIFYSKGVSLLNLGISLGLFLFMGILNRLKVLNVIPYLIGGIIMWYFMYHSGVHATISGILLAFVVPFGNGNEKSTSYRLQHFLHKPVSFIILPIFALANTAIIVNGAAVDNLKTANSLGIFLGLFIGKPLGIFMFSLLAVTTGICNKPDDIKWKYLLGVGILGGIGFTMSIFISLLAFDGNEVIDSSKIAVILTSALSAIIGFVFLHKTLPLKQAA